MAYSNSVFNWLEPMVPKKIRSDSSLSKLDRARATAMMATLGFSITAPLIILLVLVFFHAFTNKDFSQGIIIVIIVEVFMVTQHLYFQSYGNLALTSRAYGLQYLFSIIATVLYTGGWHSPAIPLLFCVPIIVYMTISYQAAMRSLLLVLFIYAGLMALYTGGYELSNIMPNEIYDYILITCWGLCFLVLALFLMMCQHLEKYSATH